MHGSDPLERRGTSLVVQWLRLHTSSAVGLGSIPGQGTKILHITRHSQKKKKKKKPPLPQRGETNKVTLIIAPSLLSGLSCHVKAKRQRNAGKLQSPRVKKEEPGIRVGQGSKYTQTNEREERAPEICTGSPLSPQMRSTEHRKMKKLPQEHVKQTSGKIYLTRTVPKIVTVPTSQSEKTS